MCAVYGGTLPSSRRVVVCGRLLARKDVLELEDVLVVGGGWGAREGAEGVLGIYTKAAWRGVLGARVVRKREWESFYSSFWVQCSAQLSHSRSRRRIVSCLEKKSGSASMRTARGA